MKTNKVHRNLTDAITPVSPSDSVEHAVSQRRYGRHHEYDADDPGSADTLSFRNFENFKMALFFNKIQSQLAKK